jgi:hypothetical protein
MSIRTSSLHRGLVRAGAVSVATLASVALWAPAAGAAPAVTIPLDPGYVELSLRPSNGGALQPYSSLSDPYATPVGARFGGTVTFTVPAELTSTDPTLDVTVIVDDPADVPDGSNDATYSRVVDDPLVEQPLVVADLGGGTFEVTMPADGGVHGPEAVLALGPLEPTANTPGTVFIDPAHWRLALTSGGPASATLTSQIVAVACPPGSVQPGCPTTATRVPWGGQLQFSLPTGSKLSQLGVTDLRGMAQPVFTREQDVTVWPTTQGSSWNYLTSADGRTATLAMFGLTDPLGKYVVTVAIGNAAAPATPGLIAFVAVPIEIVAADNAGLRSNTGWGESDEPSGSPSAPLVALGGTMIIVAGVTGAVVVRRRRVVAAE